MKKNWYDEKRTKAIAGWQDLKYGMFIHFGLFSLCGGVWDGQQITRGYSEQILSHGNVPQADYEKLQEQFTIEHFNPTEIVTLARKSGMKYIVFVTKHHDGFCLFDTRTTTYSSANAPCHRDLVRELATECAAQGLRFGLYFSWIDWHCPYAWPISPHNSDPITPEHMEYNMLQLTELLTNYGPVCELWMDMGAPTPSQSKAVADLAHRLQPDIMVNGRVWNDYGDFQTMADNALPDCELDVPWQTPATIYHATWGFRSWQERDGLEEKVRTIYEGLTQVVSHGGNYLLNIGPAGDGSLVPFETRVLEALGRKIAEKGLIHLSENQESVIAMTREDRRTLLEDGTPRFRFSGAEYYSLHQIITSYNWEVFCDEPFDVRVSYKLSTPLGQEQKLCFETDDDTIVFSLKQGIQDYCLSSSVHLHAGRNSIKLYTPGNPVRRPEFPAVKISLCLEK